MGQSLSRAPPAAHPAAPSEKGDGAAGLAALEALYARDLALLNLPVAKWTPELSIGGAASPIPVTDVLIIGAGMAGICLAIALQHAGVGTRLLDKAPVGYEGPWDTTARMETLRSPKHLVGPALGFAHLTFQAWFIAQWGTSAWAALDKIPRVQWMEYLRWLRRVNSVTVENDSDVVLVQPNAAEGGGPVAAVKVRRGGVDAPVETIFARHVVLATGRDGLGGPWLPDWAAKIPADRRFHSGDVWDGSVLKDKIVAVIGGGSSAMDCAATALESDAAAVHLLIRRHDLPRVNKSKASVGPGIAHGFHRFPDAWKWQYRHYMNLHIPPPHGSTLRVSRHPNAFFLFDAPVEKVGVRETDGRVRVGTPRGSLAADVVVFCTGFASDWSKRPEFAPFAQHVLQWQDVYTPPAALRSTDMGQSPYLGPLFEFRAKTPGACPGLERLHCFCYPAALSLGTISGDIPQISDGARMLASGLAGALYAADVETHFRSVQQYDDPELDGQEWTPAVWPAYTEE